ncbi:MAG: SRPBCC family protein [Frankiaceae bacterium]|nr:SRPBCC family protein [Frankiaceae bacterium]MBV9869053.1 SRPBCC family protein [Frankiaceae bacterium]
MQRFETVFDVDAPPHRVWKLLHRPPPPGSPSPRTVEYQGGSMTILLEGDENGQGMVRTCEFHVPKWLLSGGKARSWELVTEVKPLEYAKYEGIGKPLWSRAAGWHELQPLDSGGTRLTFVETYHVNNRVMRALFEKRVHRFISKDNHDLYLSLLGYLGTVTHVSTSRHTGPA